MHSLTEYLVAWTAILPITTCAFAQNSDFEWIAPLSKFSKDYKPTIEERLSALERRMEIVGKPSGIYNENLDPGFRVLQHDFGNALLSLQNIQSYGSGVKVTFLVINPLAIDIKNFEVGLSLLPEQKGFSHQTIREIKAGEGVLVDFVVSNIDVKKISGYIFTPGTVNTVQYSIRK